MEKNKDQKPPLVSVIMPVYNGEPYLKSAMDSIRNQTFSNWELICVDDCSTDRSLAIVHDFAKKDERIRVFKNSSKKYLSGSLNFALTRTHGKYIARMDADDVSLPNRFESQIKLLESNKQLVAVGGWEEIIDERDNLVGVKTFPTDSDICYRLLMTMMPIQPPLLMARAEVMKKLRYDTGLSKHDDIDMHFKLIKFGDFSNVETVIFRYRKRMNSYTLSNVKKVFFMALFVRLRAILRHGYRPSWYSCLICLAQVVLVALLPSFLIVKIFEWMRLSRNQKAIPSLAFQTVVRD